MFKSVVAALAALLVVAAPAAHAAGKAPWEKYADRIAASQEVGRLGDDVVGDSIALNDGGLTFAATDASLPGNAGPGVQVGRSYRVRDMKHRGIDGVFADWDVDVPYISSNFLGAWVGTNGSQSRCTYGGPPSADASRGIMPWDFWNGLSINIPGVGGGSVLRSNGLQPEGTSIVNYPYLTNDHITGERR